VRRSIHSEITKYVKMSATTNTIYYYEA